VDSNVAYGIAVVEVGDEGSKLEVVKHFDEHVFRQHMRAIQLNEHVLRHLPTELMRSSWASLNSSISFHSHLTANAVRRAYHMQQLAGPAIGSKIFAWLSLSRLFTDHSSHELSERFGKDSPEYARFIKSTNWAFDNSVGFRIVSQFRNVFQHAGFPPISFNAKRQESDRRYELEVVVARDRLLAAYEWKQKVREDIQAFPAQFPLLPLLSGAMVQFEFIAGQFREALRAAADEPLAALEAEVGDLGDDGQALSLAKVTRLGHDDLHIEQLPIDLNVIARCRQMPPIPGIPESWRVPCLAWPEHSCSGGPIVASTTIVFPHQRGIAFVASCDKGVTMLGKEVANRFGANQVVHPSMVGYIESGLEARGINVIHVDDASQLGELDRTDQPLPPLGMDLSPRGWRITRDKAVVSRTRLAAALLEVWAQEGGGTQRFLSEVDRFVRAGGPEPLLTGLVNLSAQSLTLLSSLLGSDIEDIIGELVDEMRDASASDATASVTPRSI
jgi:hypothetical protein